MNLPKRIQGFKSDPRQDPMSIGNLAISRGYATQDQISHALKKQEERLPLGEILVENGVLTHGQLEELLLEQEISRNRLSPVKAARLVRKRRREKMSEVTQGFKEVTAALGLLAKT